MVTDVLHSKEHVCSTLQMFYFAAGSFEDYYLHEVVQFLPEPFKDWILIQVGAVHANKQCYWMMVAHTQIPFCCIAQIPKMGVVGVAVTALALLLPLCCMCCRTRRESSRKTAQLKELNGKEGTMYSVRHLGLAITA